MAQAKLLAGRQLPTPSTAMPQLMRVSLAAPLLPQQQQRERRRTAAARRAKTAAAALQLRRRHPAAFAAVAAAADSAGGHLQLLQDPLWLATLGAAHAWQQRGDSSSNRSTSSYREYLDLPAALEEGAAVAEAARAAAAAAGEDDPFVRLDAAVLVGEAAELLHAIGEASGASDGGGAAAPAVAAAGEHLPPVAAATQGMAHALELWQLRLSALPFSLSLLTLAARGAAAWRPQPCSGLSGVAATPLLQIPAAGQELLLLLQQLAAAQQLLASMDAVALPQQMQHLRLRCMQALQQAQQLTAQLALPAATAAATATFAEAAVTAATTDPARFSSRQPAAALTPPLRLRDAPEELHEAYERQAEEAATSEPPCVTDLSLLNCLALGFRVS